MAKSFLLRKGRGGVRKITLSFLSHRVNYLMNMGKGKK